MSEQKVIPYFEILEDIMFQQMQEIDDKTLQPLLLRLDEEYYAYDSMTILYTDGHAELRDKLQSDTEFCDLLRRVMMYYVRSLIEDYHEHKDINVRSVLTSGFVLAIENVRLLSSKEDIDNGRIIDADSDKLDTMVILAVLLLEMIRRSDYEESKGAAE